MSSEEIIDPTAQNEVGMRKALFHLALPFGLTILAVGAIAWVGLSSYRTTREGVTRLTQQLVEAVQSYIVQEVGDYILPAAAGNQIASGMIEHAPVQVQDKVFYSYAGTMLRKIPQLQSFYLGGEDGSLRLVTRSSDPDLLDHEVLIVKNGHEYFHHELYNLKGQKVSEHDEDAGTYNLHTRPWFTSTKGSSEIKWTQPYLFADSKQFVMTSSLRFKGADGNELVFATNISLNELSSYLDHIKIGQTGSAMIVDSQGRIMAGRNLDQKARAAHWNPDNMRIDPKDEPVFALGYDHYRVQGFGVHSVAWNGRRYIVMASALPRYSQGWVLLIAVPEKDMASFAQQSSRQSLQFAGIIIVFSALLGGLFIRQVRRTDRGVRALQQQEQQVEQESAAARQVAVSPGLFDPTIEPLVLTEQLALVTDCRRASLWRFLHDGAAMVCEDSYDHQQDTHTGGFEMGRAELNSFFSAIDEGTSFTVINAAADERTSRFERLVMREIGTTMLAVFPVHGPRGIAGMVALENPRVLEHQQYFVDIVSAVAGMRFAAMGGGEKDPSQHGNPLITQASRTLPPLLTDNMLMHTAGMGGLTGANVYNAVAVLIISFSDPEVEGAQETEALISLIDQLATHVQSIALEQQLFAVEVAGHRMICMAGCGEEEDPTALSRLADAALKMRETFMGALAAVDLEPVFTMGMDYGPAFGGLVGQAPQVFNLWGQTVSLAELMAEGASDPGVIQVTERVYATLRDRYLFRSRGTFFTPHLGLGRAYTLAASR